jgi:hypothetical protein
MKQLLMFILLASLLCWFMFAPIYKHVAIMRQAVLQKEVDYMLEVGAAGIHGYINEGMIENSRQRLAERGFDASRAVYTITTTSGVPGGDAAAPVSRGTGIGLEISYPYEQLFFIDRLVGISAPLPASRMGAAGMKMSEYVP